MTLATNFNSIALSYWYMGIFIAAYTFQTLGILMGLIPKETFITLLTLPISISCARKITQANNERREIKKLIVLNLIAIHLYSLLLFIGLLIYP
jgi:1,4-dihydroxy-2-naphthoate octaprenyltransferase